MTLMAKEDEKTDLSAIDYDQTFRNIRQGGVVKGHVLRITPKDVMVDIGYKSEGLIAAEEFSNVPGLKVGDEVDVYLESIENEEGRCTLSRRKAEKSQGWDKVVAGMKEESQVQGKVVRKIKGGLILDIGVEAFLPASLVLCVRLEINEEVIFPILPTGRPRLNFR